MADAAFQRGYRFGSHRLDIVMRELRDGGGEVVPLSGKAFDVLCHLIAHRDRIVGKDELLSEVWAHRVVEENNLSQAIASLRRALGQHPDGHRYIITVQGRGYRFVAEVHDLPSEEAIPAASPLPMSGRGRRMNLRRIGLPLVVLAGAMALGYVATRHHPATVLPTRGHTIAVLPFRQISPNVADNALQLGMADTLVTRLSRSTPLVVRSLDATRRLDVGQDSPQQIARLLHVDYLVDGSMQRSGETLRVNVRLLAAGDGRALWAGTFDAPADRALVLQDRIADAVAQTLSLRLTQLPSGARSPCEGSNVEAYRAYISGRYLNNRPDSVRLQAAVRDFKHAIDLDPSCARAYAGLAFAYRGEVMTGDRRPRDLFPLAKAAVAQALAIDPTLAEAYATRGFIEFWYDWDWPAAEASLRRAIELNPALPEAHLAYAHLLSNLGRSEEAVREARLALRADPLSPLINTLAAGFMKDAGHDAEAKAQLDRALELDPDFWVALLSRGGDALFRGDVTRALSDLRRARVLSHDNSQALVLLAFAELRAGDRPAAEDILVQLQARQAAGYVPSTSVAAVELALGRRQAAMALLEQAYDERDVRLSFIGIDHRFDALRGTSRFRALLRRMRLDGRGTAGVS